MNRTQSIGLSIVLSVIGASVIISPGDLTFKEVTMSAFLILGLMIFGYRSR